jgi:hypothetical protein
MASKVALVRRLNLEMRLDLEDAEFMIEGFSGWVSMVVVPGSGMKERREKKKKKEILTRSS